MSYAELSDPSPVLPALVESKVSCSRCGEKFELGQRVRDNFVRYNTGELKSIEHLHDHPCKFKVWEDDETPTDAFGVELLPQCAKCRTTDSMEFHVVEYPENDGTTTTHYGCTSCIDDMENFVAARREYDEAVRIERKGG